MDPLWIELRQSVPQRINVETLLQNLHQALQSDDANETAGLSILGVFQEMAQFLFLNQQILKATFATLVKEFMQQRQSGNPMYGSQILCTLTTMIIETGSDEALLIELVNLLLDVIEKVKGWCGEGLIEGGEMIGNPNYVLVARSLNAVSDKGEIAVQVMSIGPMEVQESNDL
eukprot:Em0022g720a